MPFLSVDVVCRFWEAGGTLATIDQISVLRMLRGTPLPKELKVLILEKYLLNQIR